ncbi:hypothetical protein NLM27_27060 [Bradyrhizobium sp. CCGB12]|uniref:hypothetical protein n=1 Tax=Bradyrhizobium sp. CCGB12 TaxID=2949632 RepID=UPI0020B1ECAE|nr:hypothetical protein [Bradyrhizobium sp. CCGB12]MCP3392410.1 hypothetical protein [Bradyrhizobium sp. CCGB12]
MNRLLSSEQPKRAGPDFSNDISLELAEMVADDMLLPQSKYGLCLANAIARDAPPSHDGFGCDLRDDDSTTLGDKIRGLRQ